MGGCCNGWIIDLVLFDGIVCCDFGVNVMITQIERVVKTEYFLNWKNTSLICRANILYLNSNIRVSTVYFFSRVFTIFLDSTRN